MPLYSYMEALKAKVKIICVLRSLYRAKVAHQLGGAFGYISAFFAEFLGIDDAVITGIGSGEPGEFVCMGHPVEIARIDDSSAEGSGMAVHVLCGAVCHYVSTPFKRSAVDGGGKRVVKNERNAVGVGCLCKAFNIKYDQSRVRNGLTEYGFGVGTECSLKFLV